MQNTVVGSNINHNKRNYHKHPAFILHLLLATCITHLITYPALQAQASTTNTGGSSNTNINTKAGSDIFYIRHGRSRVRHSNERWNLQGFNNTTTLEKDDDNEGNGNTFSIAGVVGSGTADGSGSSIASGNGQLFGSDYWQNSEANGTLLFQAALHVAATTEAALPLHTRASPIKVKPTTLTAQVAVTHKIRKLHKKKIMESIRKSVEEKGLKLPKNHRSLAEAEHLQGRVLDEDENADIGSNNILLMDAPEEDGNQNESADYAGTTTTMVTTTYYEPDKADIDDDSPSAEQEEEEEEVQEERQRQKELDTFLSNARNEPATTTTDATYANELKTATNTVTLIAKNQSITTSNDGTHSFETADSQQQQKQKLQQEQRNDVNRSWPTKQHQPQEQNSLIAAAEEEPNAFTEPEYNLDDETLPKASAAAADTNSYAPSVADIEHDYHETASEKPTSDKQHQQHAFSALANNDNDNEDFEAVSQEPSSATTPLDESDEAQLLGFNQAASTSVGGIGLDRALEFEEINLNFDDNDGDDDDDNDDGNDNLEDAIDDGVMDSRDDTRFPLNSPDAAVNINGGGGSGGEDDIYETNKFLEGVVDAANADEIYDWDEISRNNRRNLMRGRDVVTKFLQIVETQHSLGSNCEAGTSLNLGEGVVDRYAQDRFRVEAEVAVNRANMLTRIFKMTSSAVQASVNLLHASVLSMVEFDDDIFAAGNCFDWNQHPSQPGLFCPFAYRLPPPNLGAIFAKDLATEYHYLGNTSEWFFQARKNAEKVIIRNEQYLKAFHLYSNKTDERIEENTLAVKYEDGRWSKPYYDCGGGNIWMLTYTVPFFGYDNGTYIFKGTSGIDIDLRRVDIDQCPQRNTPGTTQPLNIFAGTDKCKQRTTMCEALKGLGFRRGSYKCVCRKGYYFPDTASTQKFFNGSLLEEEYEKLMLGKNSTYNIVAEYECLPCAEGCDSCEDGSPCIAALNWPMRTSILVLACTVIGLLPPAAWFTFRYQQVKVVRAASPALLRVIALGAFFIYCTTIVMYSNPNLYTCTARIWLREIGFSLTYGALMLKTWRISVIFRVRSAKAVKITDAALLKRLGVICGVIGTCLLVRTLVSPPDVVVGRTADDLKAFLCKTDWWDYTFTSMEVLFLAWGVRLCIMVRKAPSEFNESRFISMAIYNEFLLTCFLNVSMLFLQSPANPDLLYIIFFCHTQLTVTLLLGLIFGSKVYIVLRSGKSHQESIGLGAKSSGAKFNFRPQVRTFANPSSVTTSTAQLAGGTTSAEVKLSDQEALEEIRQLSVQLQRIQEMAPPKGVAVMTISSLLDGLKTPGGLMMVAAAAGSSGVNQFALKQQQQLQPQGSLPLLALNSDLHKYNQPLQLPQNNNLDIIHKLANGRETTTTVASIVATVLEHKSVNTSLTGEDFRNDLLSTQAHFVCECCLKSCREHYSNGSCRPSTPTLCQRLGSPQPEGSISFSNIKLECMCSQPDDIDRQHTTTLLQRRVSQRTAATNTPPSVCRRRSKTKGNNRSSTHHGSCSSLAEAQKVLDDDAALCDTQTQRSDGDTFPICDSCKNKFNSKSRSSSKRSRLDGLEYKSSAATMSTTKQPTADTKSCSQTRSNELLDRLGTSAGAAKKVHSTDDVAFYTTTDDDDGSGDDENVTCTDSTTIRRRRPQRQHELICQSTSALSSNVAMPCLADFAAPSTSSSTVTGSSVAPVSDAQGVAATAVIETVGAQSAHSDGNISANSNSSSNNGNGQGKSNGRSKRPDKLMLDLNDRSKYTKEVSV